jgi:HK97 gp10 family phage protein
MANSSWEIKLEGMEELLDQFKGMDRNVKKVLRAAVSAAGELVAENARHGAPGPEIDIHVARVTEKVVEVDIGPTRQKWYYGLFETGVQPHEIKAKHKPYLVFPGASGKVFAKSVRHPGMPAQPFLRPALLDDIEQTRDEMGQHLRTAIDNS